MWAMTSFGILMPAIRPPKTVARGDDRTMQIRTRRAKDLDILRARYMQSTLGPTIHTPKFDYEYRAYCTPHAFALAMAQMILEIDYLKFKPTTEDRFGDKQLHDCYNGIWSTVMTRLSSSYHQWEYWNTRPRTKVTGTPATRRGVSLAKDRSAEGTVIGPRWQLPADAPNRTGRTDGTDWNDRIDRDTATGWGYGAHGYGSGYGSGHDSGYGAYETGYGGGLGGYTNGEHTRLSERSYPGYDTSPVRDNYQPDPALDELDAAAREPERRGRVSVDALYDEIDDLTAALTRLDHSGCHHGSAGARNRCTRKQRKAIRARIEDLRSQVDAYYDEIDALIDTSGPYELPAGTGALDAGVEPVTAPTGAGSVAPAPVSELPITDLPVPVLAGDGAGRGY